jgi:hypothetical protein
MPYRSGQLTIRKLAERVGFEPTEPVKAHSISNAANSTTLAPFRNWLILAERVGFEPTVPVKAQQFSRLPDSTTLAPLRANL